MEAIKTYSVFYKEGMGVLDYKGTYGSKMKVYEDININFEAEDCVVYEQDAKEEIVTDTATYLIVEANVNDRLIVGIIEWI